LDLGNELASGVSKVDLKGQFFTYNINESVLLLARTMDGKHLLISNVSDLRAEEVVARCPTSACVRQIGVLD
jgi:hypothetical protein